MSEGLIVATSDDIEWQCEDCGSARVTVKDACSWDPALQLWVVPAGASAAGGAWCPDCEGEVDVGAYPHVPPPGRGQREMLPLALPPPPPGRGRRGFACSGCGGRGIVVVMDCSWSVALQLWVGSGEPDAGGPECFCVGCGEEGPYEERAEEKSEGEMLEDTVR